MRNILEIVVVTSSSLKEKKVLLANYHLAEAEGYDNSHEKVRHLGRTCWFES